MKITVKNVTRYISGLMTLKPGLDQSQGGVDQSGDYTKTAFDTNDYNRTDILDAEIKTLEKNLRNYDERRAIILDAMELGEFQKKRNP